MKFEELNLELTLLDGLDAMGFETATPIQEQAIPLILNNKDLIACAQTGTGKTAAFLLPILNKIVQTDRSNSQSINTIVIAPTRELALQIDQQVEGFGYFLGVSSLPVYGGGDANSWDNQKKALSQGADIIIATPGRLLSHLKLGYVNTNDLEHLVLDEADRMLDMGFFEDIMQIIEQIPKQRQTLMFSATMPSKIRKLAKEILTKPEQISIAVSKPAEGVLQVAYLVYEDKKVDLIEALLEGKQSYASIIIFTSTKKAVSQIVKRLGGRGFDVGGISSDLEQHERESVLRSFRSRKLQILVATDILSRGIDIKDINLVVNYNIPQDAEDYVHRIGRTARADSTGVAITFISELNQHKFHKIEALIEQEIRKVPCPASVGESPAYTPTKRKKNGYKRKYKKHPKKKYRR